MIGNIHTILNSPWMVSQSFLFSHLGMLQSFIETGKLGESSSSQALKLEKVAESLDYAPEQMSSAFTIPSLNGKYIGVLKLHGPLMKYNANCGPLGTQTLTSQVNLWRKDEKCIGLIQDVDTPGGQVAGIKALTTSLEKFNKPKVSYVRGDMCSGGVHLGVTSDVIIADESSEHFGSIGVQMTYLDVIPMYEEKGAKYHVLTSEGSEEKNKHWLNIAKGEYEGFIKEEMNPAKEKFIALVKKHRVDISDKAFTGASFGLDTAIEMGLVDSVGSLEDAVSYIHKDEEIEEQDIETMENTDKPTLAPLVSSTLGVEEISYSLAFGEEQESKPVASLDEVQISLLEEKLQAQHSEIYSLKEDKNKVKALISELNLEIKDGVSSVDTLISFAKEMAKKDGDVHSVVHDNGVTETAQTPSYVNPNSNYFKILKNAR